MATPVAISCNGCTQTQILNLGKSLGIGNHYIYDLPGNAIYLLHGECEPNSTSTVTCYTPDVETVSAPITTQFSQYHTLYVQNRNTEIFNETITVSLPSGNPVGRDGFPLDNGKINAYDTLVASYLENQVLDYLNNPASWIGAQAIALQTAQAAQSQVINFNGLSLVVIAKYNDGSMRSYKYDPNLHSFAPIPNSARDAHGNTILENGLPNRNAIFNFSGSDGAPNGPGGYDYHNLFWDLLMRSPPPGDVTCVQLGWDGQTLTCTVRQK